MRRIERAGHAKALDPTLGLVPEKTVPLGESTRDSPALGPLPPPKKLPRRGHFWTPMGGGQFWMLIDNHALRSRGHSHTHALRSITDRSLNVVRMTIETRQTYDLERRSKGTA